MRMIECIAIVSLLLLGCQGCRNVSPLAADLPITLLERIELDEVSPARNTEVEGHSASLTSFNQDLIDSESESPIEAVPMPDEDLSFRDVRIGDGPEVTRGVTLEQILEIAAANNSSLQQAVAAAAQARGVHQQVGLEPNPSVGYFADELGNDNAAGLHGVFVSQTFVRGEKLAWNRTVLGHEVNEMHWRVAAQGQRVETDIRTQFFKALAAQERLRQATSFQADSALAVDIARQRLAAGEASKPDLLQSELLVNEIELAIESAELDWEANWRQLAAIAGKPNMDPAVLIGDLELDTEVMNADQLFEEFEVASPVIKAAQARVDRACANINRQSVQSVSNVNTQWSAGYDDGTGDAFAGFQVSVPIPVQNWNQGNIQAARAEHIAAQRNVDRIKSGLRQSVAKAVYRYNLARAKVLRYRDAILPKARESLQLIEQAQLAGEVEFLRLLNARYSYFETNQKLIAAYSDMAAARAEIDGQLLTNSLAQNVTYEGDDGLRDQALSGQ